jgi:hypothetical protein
MRTTLTIDDVLITRARALAEPGMDTGDLLRECVHAFIERQAARRLAALGGQIPDMSETPRRRESAAEEPTDAA